MADLITLYTWNMHSITGLKQALYLNHYVAQLQKASQPYKAMSLLLRHLKLYISISDVPLIYETPKIFI